MNFITYLIAAIVSYLGVFAGNLLIFIAPEELAPGRKYFRYFFFIMLSASIFFFIYVKNGGIAISLFIALLVLLFSSFLYKRFPLLKYAIYPLLGFFLGLSAKSDMFTIMASLVFLTGFPFGSYIIKEYRKKDRKVILKNTFVVSVSFFVFAIIFWFV
ncbi:MAG: hypothetical protein ACLFPQ_00645 [Candidatus Woesearchaeota archaeon]